MDKLRLNSALLFVIAVVAVGSVLRLTGSIFLPLVIALLLSFVFTPVISYLSRHRVPRIVSIFFVLVIFLAFGFLVGLVLYSSTQSLLREFPKYQHRFAELSAQLITRLNLPSNILEQVNLNRTIGSILVSFSGSFMSFVSGLTLVFIFLLFILLEQPYLHSKMTQAVKGHATRRVTIIVAHITAQIGRYLSVKLFVSALTGVVIFVSFSIIGVDFPIIWGILTFLFNFIPSIGSIVITALSFLFAILQFVPDWNFVAATAIAMFAAQMLIGNILDPKLLGDRLNLSPVVILLSLLLWGWLWGVMGMFLAVPLTVAIKLAFQNIPGMEPAGILMGTGIYKRRRRKQKASRKSAEKHGT